MRSLRTLFASSAVLLLAACGASKGPKPVNPDDVKGPETPDDLGDLPTPPGVPGPVDLTLTCHDKDSCSHGDGYVYNTPDYTIDIHANQVACRNLNGTFQLDIKSADGTDQIYAELIGYSAPGQYRLNDPGVSYISFAADGEKPVCRDGALTDPLETNPEGLRAMAPDPGCGAGSCTIFIEDTDPSAAYPKQFKFRVRCAKACESMSEYICTAPNKSAIDFTVAGVCQDHQ